MPRRNRSGRSKNGSRLPAAGSEYRANTRENRAALSMVKSMKGPNNKYINTVANAIALSPTLASPGLICLNAVTTGNTENTRIGRLVRHNWIDIDFTVVQVPNTNNNDTILFRAYIIVESTALGSQLAPAQFFVDNASFGPYSQRDRTNRNASRFVVLWDSGSKVLGNPYRTNGTTTTYVLGAGQPAEIPFNLHLPLGFYTDYSRGTAGTYADIETNSLWLMVVTDDSTADISVSGAYTTCFNDDS